MESNSIPKTIQQKVYSQLLAQILGGEIEPGTQLVDRKIAEKLGVSRTPVREALSILAKESIIEGFPKWGYFTKKFTVSDIEMIYDIREGLEAIAARLAAQNITEPEAYNLEQLCEETASPKLNKKYDTVADRNLHKEIAVISKNTYLQEMIVNHYVLSVMSLNSLLPDLHPEVIKEEGRQFSDSAIMHVKIVKAIVEHRADDAEHLMRMHLKWAKDTIRKRFGESGQQDK
jgi:DNA-binding GntR family transcriptional regulator